MQSVESSAQKGWFPAAPAEHKQPNWQRPPGQTLRKQLPALYDKA